MDAPGKPKSYSEINTALRERSGNVVNDDRLTSFLYELMRDHVPPGEVEKLVRDLELDDSHGNTSSLFSNGWLACYAEDLAKRLTRSSRTEQCSPDRDKSGDVPNDEHD